MIKPSREQKKIIKKINHNNIIVQAVPGSGKTTTALLIFKEYFGENILHLTYNAHLKSNLREKFQQLIQDQGRNEKKAVETINIHSFHSLARTTYNWNYYTDDDIYQILNDNQLPIIKKIPKWKIIIIDEAQDMNLTYFLLVKKYLKDTGNENACFCFLGDSKQAVWGSKGGSNKYLKLANQLFKNNWKWINLSLSTSYRFNQNCADFVNGCCTTKTSTLENKIKAHNKEIQHRPQYYFNELQDSNWQIKLWDIIKKYIKDEDGVFVYSDLMILAPSLKWPAIIKFSNYLAQQKIPVYNPQSDERKSKSDEETKNKVLFSTYHSAKGLERKVVLVFGFDQSGIEVFTRHDKTINSNNLSNLHYVAITRPQQTLILLQNSKHALKPVIRNQKIIQNYIDCKSKNWEPFTTTCDQDKTLAELSVTDLLKQDLDLAVRDECYNTIQNQKLQVNDQTKKITVKQKIHIHLAQKTLIYQVQNIFGTAINGYINYQLNLKSSQKKPLAMIKIIEDSLKEESQFFKLHYYGIYKTNVETFLKKIQDIQEKINNATLSNKDWLEIATINHVVLTNQINEYTQLRIKKWEWEDISTFEKTYQNLLLIEPKFEKITNYNFEYGVSDLLNNIYGSIDLIDFDHNIIYEFKTGKIGTQNQKILKNNDILQLAIYNYLINKQKNKIFQAKLIYLTEGKMFTFTLDQQKFAKGYEKLIKESNMSQKVCLTDKVFLQKNLKEWNKFQNKWTKTASNEEKKLQGKKIIELKE